MILHTDGKSRDGRVGGGSVVPGFSRLRGRSCLGLVGGAISLGLKWAGHAVMTGEEGSATF